jgi:hypothetical protein
MAMVGDVAAAENVVQDAFEQLPGDNPLIGTAPIARHEVSGLGTRPSDSSRRAGPAIPQWPEG